MTNSPLLNSPLGLIKSIRQFSQLRRKCEGEIATAKRFSSTPIFSGGLCVAKRRKGRPVEALQGRNELECMVRVIQAQNPEIRCWNTLRVTQAWLLEPSNSIDSRG